MRLDSYYYRTRERQSISSILMIIGFSFATRLVCMIRSYTLNIITIVIDSITSPDPGMLDPIDTKIVHDRVVRSPLWHSG